MFGIFFIRKLFDISCISDQVQSISKPLSVVLAGLWSAGLCRNIHVVTWSVQENSCTVLLYYVVTLVSTKGSTETDQEFLR